MDTAYVLRTQDLSEYAALKNPIMEWTRRWHKPGEFKLTIPYRSDIQYGHIISKGIEAGIVRGIVIEASDKDGDVMTITGPMLAGLSRQRILISTYSAIGTAEYVMWYIAIHTMFIGQITKFPGLTIQPVQGYSGDTINYQNERVPVDGELTALSESSGLGYDIVLDGPGMLFRILEGKDRTESQSINKRAVFSIERHNILKAEFEMNGEKHTNAAYFYLDGLINIVGSSSGFERYDFPFNPPDVSKDEEGNANTLAEQREILTNLAKQKMTPMTLSLVAKIDPLGNLKYKQDYDLGDICTCKVDRWGVSINARITEIKEIYSKAGVGLEVTFGTGHLSYTQNIRRIANV